jgi:hypothetical protein
LVAGKYPLTMATAMTEIRIIPPGIRAIFVRKATLIIND